MNNNNNNNKPFFYYSIIFLFLVTILWTQTCNFSRATSPVKKISMVILLKVDKAAFAYRIQKAKSQKENETNNSS